MYVYIYNVSQIKIFVKETFLKPSYILLCTKDSTYIFFSVFTVKKSDRTTLTCTEYFNVCLNCILKLLLADSKLKIKMTSFYVTK